MFWINYEFIEIEKHGPYKSWADAFFGVYHDNVIGIHDLIYESNTNPCKEDCKWCKKILDNMVV